MLRNESFKDSLILQFLENQNINNKTWINYLRSSNLEFNEIMLSLKELALWFRSQFPYYYGYCTSCNKRSENAFTGYIFPTNLERLDKAGRTELYYCSNCTKHYRFPRFNNVIKVGRDSNRYHILLFSYDVKN